MILNYKNIINRTVNTYADLLLINPSNYRIDVFVVTDTVNNDGNSSEYSIYPDGTVMMKASINTNQL